MTKLEKALEHEVNLIIGSMPDGEEEEWSEDQLRISRSTVDVMLDALTGKRTKTQALLIVKRLAKQAIAEDAKRAGETT